MLAALGLIGALAIREDAAREQVQAAAQRTEKTAASTQRRVEKTIATYFRTKFERDARIFSGVGDGPHDEMTETELQEEMASRKNDVSCIRTQAGSNQFSCLHGVTRRDYGAGSNSEGWRTDPSPDNISAIVDPRTGEVQLTKAE